MSRRFWRVCLANFCFFLAYYLVMPAFPLASLAVGARPGQMGDVLGLASAVQILVAMFLVGPAIDGGRRRPFLLAGACIYGGVALALTQVHSFLPFVLVGALAGVGIGCFSSAAMAEALSSVPDARRGEAIGIVGSLTTVAISVGPPVAVALTRISLNWVYLAIAAASFAAGAVAWGLPDRPGQPEASGPAGRRRPVIAPAAVPAALVMLAMCAMYGSLLTYLARDALGHGVANPGFFFTLMAAAVLVVRLWAGRAADRMAKGRLILPGIALMAGALLLVEPALRLRSLIPLGLVFGLGYGLSYPPTLALMDERAGSAGRGKAMAMYSAAFTAGVGFGPLALAPVVSAWGFTAAFPVAAGLGVALIAPFIHAYTGRAWSARGAPAPDGRPAREAASSPGGVGSER